jgi:two-component system cell cycle sensor histidine kinase/response regulator CckA
MDPLRLVLVEDTDDDAALVMRALRQAGVDTTVLRVQTAEDFARALADPPDLIICDHSLPGFSSTAALTSLHERGLDIPFIVVSGTIDEESAVAILRAGAHDFVTKQNLARLGPAIRRELQEARNRTERRHAQDQLQVQRNFLRLVLDSNPAVIFVKDWEGRYTLANRATADVFGITPDELMGKTDRDFNAKVAEVERFLETDRAVISNGVPVYIEREPATDMSTGRVRWFETHKVPLIVPNNPPQILGIGIDITERVAAEEALRVSEEQFRQAQKMEAVGLLAGGIAHDFNNLLTAILGYSALLLERVQDQPDVAEDIEEIRKAGERASGLTRQLLAFSRKQVLAPQVLDLKQVVADVEKMLRRILGEDVRLRTVTAQTLQRVKADPGQIEQALLNLAINARDAMPTGGMLTLELANAKTPRELKDADPKAPDDCVAVSVTDTGSGMSPEVRKRIFEPFFSTKSPGRGTGLGLSMVYGVVKQSGGHIMVESEPDHGTRFTIYLPATTDREPLTARSSHRASDLRGTETILLVEDEIAIRELVRKVLTGYGYEVLEAPDARAAVRLAEKHARSIHLLLSDIVMPGLSGPELAQRLALSRPDMRVLYMSGFGSRLSTGFGSLSSQVALLHKPFTPEILATKVRECLNRDVVQGHS